eukprot:Opistho-2@23674
MKVLRNAKVTYFDAPLSSEEEVVGFDVAMNDALIVQVFDSHDNVAEVLSRGFLRKRLVFLLVEVHDGAVLDQLKHHVQVVLCRIVHHFNELNHIRMLQFFENRNFAAHVFHRIVRSLSLLTETKSLSFQHALAQLFHGVIQIIRCVRHSLDNAKRTATDDLVHNVLIHLTIGLLVALFLLNDRRDLHVLPAIACEREQTCRLLVHLIQCELCAESTTLSRMKAVHGPLNFFTVGMQVTCVNRFGNQYNITSLWQRIHAHLVAFQPTDFATRRATQKEHSLAVGAFCRRENEFSTEIVQNRAISDPHGCTLVEAVVMSLGGMMTGTCALIRARVIMHVSACFLSGHRRQPPSVRWTLWKTTRAPVRLFFV